MATFPKSPQLKAPWEGVPIIRICVYQRATSAPATKRYTQLPEPGKDEPQHIFGFRQTVVAENGTRGIKAPLTLKSGKKIQVGPSAGFEVVSARVNQTRFWSCSSATFTLACPFDRWAPPLLPPVRPEDVVTIELGYAPSLRVSLANPNVWFRPVFYGIVDTVKERGGSGEKDGVTLTVIARDPLRYLVDNKVRGTYLKTAANDRQNRGYAVMDLVWMGSQIDHVEWVKRFASVTPGQRDAQGNLVSPGANTMQKNGQFFETNPDGSRKPLTDPATGVVRPAEYGPENSYLKIGVIEASRRKNINPLRDGEIAGGAQGIAIMDRFPMDLIKHFSLVETAPRELFADPATGHVHWMFRRTDLRRLMGSDEAEKARRQYFYRLPENRANIIAYTNEWTTAGTVSHFTITNGLAHNSGEKKATERYAESPIAQLADPHRPLGGLDVWGKRKFTENDGAYLRQFTRQRFVYDDTMDESDELTVLANALFTIWGKDVETGMLHVIGDPTLEIGEGLQIFNTGLFGRRLYPKDINNPGTAWLQSGPPGIFRIEGIQHLYATGGPQRGYTTVIVFNSIDPPAMQIVTNADVNVLSPSEVERDPTKKGICILPVTKPKQGKKQ